MAVLSAESTNSTGLEAVRLEKWKVIDKLDRMWREAVDHPINVNWRPYAEKAFRYHRGEQLDAEMLVTLEKRGQPPVVENMIRPQRKAFMRIYHKLRLKAAFTGRNLQLDEFRAGIFNDLNRFVDQQSGFSDEEALAVKDMWICGQGWMENQAKKMPDGQPMIGSRREDPFVMWLDPYARRRDLRDARYVIRSKWVSTPHLALLINVTLSSQMLVSAEEYWLPLPQHSRSSFPYPSTLTQWLSPSPPHLLPYSLES